MERVYLDHAATTPLLAEARKAMEPWLTDGFGNPSSLHLEGRRARAAVDEARERIAAALGCGFSEVVFTSSGTESAALALIGCAIAAEEPGRRRILMGAAEHHCVLNARPILERLGCRVELIPVDRQARVRLDALDSILSDDVLLVSVMHANNEVGTLQPVRDVATACKRHGALLHVDAVQTFPCGEDSGGTFSASSLGADLLSVSAHKSYGPKGVGALYVRSGVRLKAVLPGGGQERELRAGTENVAGIVGFAASAKWLSDHPEIWQSRRRARDRFESELRRQATPGLQFTLEEGAPRLGGHSHLRFEGISAESMLIVLDRLGVAASSGAACSSGSLEPSHVLLASGFGQAEAREGLRFTFGGFHPDGEAERAASTVLQAARSIRDAR